MTDAVEVFAAAKKAEADARAVLIARLATIKVERKDAAAKWIAEEKQIHELLRKKTRTTRKPAGG